MGGQMGASCVVCSFKGVTFPSSNGESKDDKEGKDDGSETKLYSRFIGLLLFMMQKKETLPSIKLCVMVRTFPHVLI